MFDKKNVHIIYNNIHPTKNQRIKLMWSVQVISSCSTTDTCRYKIPVINHEWGEDRILLMTQNCDIFVVNLFNSNPRVMTTFFAVVLYWWNNEGNQSFRISYKLRYIYSIYKYCWSWNDATDSTRKNVMSTYFLLKPGPRAYIVVGGAIIQFCHYVDNGFLEEDKSSIIQSFTVSFGGK